MFKKKAKEPAVYLDNSDLIKLGQALAKLNAISDAHHVTIRGVLRLEEMVVGSVFYNAPAESYAIEWNR